MQDCHRQSRGTPAPEVRDERGEHYYVVMASVITVRSCFGSFIWLRFRGNLDDAFSFLLPRNRGSRPRFPANIAPTDHGGSRADAGPNGTVIVTGDREYLSRTNDADNLKYVMRLNTYGSGTRSLKRAADSQPVNSRVEFWAVVASQMLSHPPATPLRRSIPHPRCGVDRFNSMQLWLATRDAPTSPLFPRVVQPGRQINPVTA
jgi:hypothetical protein